MKKLLVVMGTRPEAIKLCPLIREMKISKSLRPIVVSTSLHKEMLTDTLSAFEVAPQHDLDLFEPGQSLSSMTARVILGTKEILDRDRPDMVVVQGDTATAFGAALASFQEGIPVAHLEAGLRTHDRLSPFPEEMNRRLISQVSSLDLAPTSTAKWALLDEGAEGERVFVTGNTVIDALKSTLSAPRPPAKILADLEDDPRRVLLVTAHRRESWGEPLARVGEALARIALEARELLILLPLHPNPAVRGAIEPKVEGLDNIRLVEPVPYEVFTRLMQRAHLILTDSGGIQEEAPSLGKPVLVLRQGTERREALEAGVAKLVGTNPEAIVESVLTLLRDPIRYEGMAKAVSPFGDGKASWRARVAIEHFLDGSPLPRQIEWG